MLKSFSFQNQSYLEYILKHYGGSSILIDSSKELKLSFQTPWVTHRGLGVLAMEDRNYGMIDTI